MKIEYKNIEESVLAKIKLLKMLGHESEERSGIIFHTYFPEDDDYQINDELGLSEKDMTIHIFKHPDSIIVGVDNADDLGESDMAFVLYAKIEERDTAFDRCRIESCPLLLVNDSESLIKIDHMLNLYIDSIYESRCR